MQISQVQPTAILLNSPAGTSYEEEWTFKLQAGLTYHAIELDTNLQEISTIKKITIDIGGVPVCYATNINMDMIDTMYNKHKAQGTFVFDLSKFEFRTQAGIYVTQLVTGLRDDVTVIVDLGTKDAADPITPTIKGTAWVTDSPAPSAPNGGAAFRPLRYELTPQAVAAGDFTWDFPSGNVRRHIQRIVFDESETTISKIIVKRGARTIRTLSRKRLDYALQRYGGVTLVPGKCLLDMCLFGFGVNGALNTAGLSFEMEVSGPGAIKTYVEGYLDIRPAQAEQ